MLEGCVPWPEDFARRYREEDYWADITLWQMLEQSIESNRHRVALIHGEERLAYSELGDRIQNLAVGLADVGLRSNDRVVVQLPNCIEFVVTLFALLRIGVIPVLALPAHRHEEIGHFVRHSEAAAYIIAEQSRGFDYRVMASEIAANSQSLRAVLVLGTPAAGQTSLSALRRSLANSTRETSGGPAPDDVALMLLSGGTTGVPKLIPRTHNDYTYNCRQSAAVAGFTKNTVFLAVLPMAHNYTLGCPGVLGALASAATVVIASDTAPNTIFRLIEEEKVSVVSAGLPLVVDWLGSDAANRYDLASLEVFMSGGARLPPELRRRVESRFDCVYQESFGTGEGLLNMTRLDDPDDIRFNSSGRPISPGDEIKIVDESGCELPDGEVGELLCRGPYTIRGYYRAPNATASAFTQDGFYRTGDAVRKINSDLYVQGRLKDLINRGGEKISCEEVENHLLAHRDIANTCVVAMPDEKFGEKACAFVILRPGATFSFEEMKSHLLSCKIAKFKVPERLEVVDTFPTSPAAKILRGELRRIIVGKIASEASAFAKPLVARVESSLAPRSSESRGTEGQPTTRGLA